MKCSIYEIRKQILNNAVDFLERSISSYHSEDYKAAILFLWSGLMLFMKLRLFDIHPTLIYSSYKNIFNIDTDKKIPIFSTFNTKGNIKTVNFIDIVNRIKAYGIKSAIIKHERSLKKIKEFRNRVEHFMNDVRKEEYLASINEIMPFINDFIEKELDEKLCELFTNWDEFLSVESFYKDRKIKMEQKIENLHYHAMADGESDYICECPNCEDGRMTQDQNELSNVMECNICGYKSEYIVCSRCNTAFLLEDWSPLNEDIKICDNCFSGMFNV